MNPEADSRLLARYADAREENAFAAFVARRLNGVYAVALRRVGGDVHLAQDVAQRVFTAVASSARQLAQHPDLTGWLYVTTRHLAANAVRTERRRKARETKAQVMATLSDSQSIEWNRVAPLLDDAIEHLGTIDRTAIILRFIERRAYADIGAALQLSEDAARMRIDRALDRLRVILKRRGIASTTAALTTALANQAWATAPVNLAGTVTSAAVTAGSIPAAGAALNALIVMTKFKIALAGLAAAVAALLAVRELRAGLELQSEAQLLQQEVASSARVRASNARLSGTQVPLAPDDPEAEELARVRQRLALLRSRPDGVVDEAMIPVTDYQNRGWATPKAAYETFQWARATRNVDQFAKVYGWTPYGKAKVDRFFDALPENVRAEYGTPERMMAMAETSAPQTPNDAAAIQILGEEDVGNEVAVHAWDRLRSRREVNGTMLFERVGDRWCVPFTDEATDRALAALDPATGRRKVTR